VKHKSKQHGSAVVRLWPAALELVLGWSSLCGWSASKVASALIESASEAKSLPIFARLTAEAKARNIIKRAEAEARAIRTGKGGQHVRR
jgi:hypothetical protein